MIPPLNLELFHFSKLMNALYKLPIVLTLWLLAALPCLAQDEPREPLQTKVYLVPITFEKYITGYGSGYRQSSEASADPFADPVDSSPHQPPQSIQEALESAGIVFDEGASATFDKKALKLTVTNTPDQFELVEVVLDNFSSQAERQITVYYEFIEVDHLDFSDWLFENVMDSDGTEFRNAVQQWIKEGKAEIIESATVLARSGQRAKVESIDEYIYPTEYNPSKAPNEVTLKDGAEAPIAATSPTAFETRNLGTTLEVDPVLGADNTTIDMNMSPENVLLEGVEKWHHKSVDPRFQTNFPTFYTMKITTQVTGHDGRYIFVGATRPLKAADPERKNPLVLHFVRGDVGSLGGWSEVKEKAE